MLSVRNLHVRYGERTVLRGVDLDAARGEIVGVIGPNGCGKTTLLRAITGVVPAVQGRIEFDEVADSLRQIPCDLALLAMGFVGPERPVLEQFKVKLTERGNVWRDPNWMTSVSGVFTAGDMQRGQSLIVWAIAEGRSAARGIDHFLMGESDLPAPLP